MAINRTFKIPHDTFLMNRIMHKIYNTLKKQTIESGLNVRDICICVPDKPVRSTQTTDAEGGRKQRAAG
jgi:hypothetical protein